MILSAKRALLVIDYTKKVMEAIGTSLRAQTMMLHAQGWAAARCFVLLSFFFFVLFFIFEFVHRLQAVCTFWRGPSHESKNISEKKNTN